MKKIHVCLVSDQPIPNILSIYHFKPDEILFITTNDMERKVITENILNALYLMELNYKDKFKKIVVQEDSLLDCKKKLDEWISGNENATFTVNITCGTKIMSIAAYEYFKDYGSNMIYMPIGKNDFMTLFPKKSTVDYLPVDLRMTVNQYLAAYGLKIQNINNLDSNHKDAQNRKDLSEWLVRHYDKVKGLLERLNKKLRKHRNEQKGHNLTTTYVPANIDEEDLLKKIGFSYENGNYSKHFSKSEIIYITGGWLEEFCYNELLKFNGKGIDNIVTGITPQNSLGRSNEFDVMFTKDNALYTVECKSLDQNYDMGTDALYKIAALQKEFGLRVESFFVSTSPHILKDGKLRPVIKARAEQFKTTVIPPDKVISIAEEVAKKLNIK